MSHPSDSAKKIHPNPHANPVFHGPGDPSDYCWADFFGCWIYVGDNFDFDDGSCGRCCGDGTEPDPNGGWYDVIPCWRCGGDGRARAK
jgi:hypothetical protein